MSRHLQYHSDYIAETRDSMNDSMKFFFENYSKIPEHERKVLELGTRQWFNRPTHHKEILLPWTCYLMSDVQEGADVDVVADAHELSRVFGQSVFSAVWASSVWEHLHSPWVAAEELMKTLKDGGVFFVQTHLTFPEHGYPNDYFRFTTEGLRRIFRSATKTVACYEYPATLTPHDRSIDWNHAAPNYLNVCISGVK